MLITNSIMNIQFRLILTIAALAFALAIGLPVQASADELKEAKVTQVIQDVRVLPSGAAPRPAALNDNDVIDLMYKLMEYRNQEIRHRLEKVGRAASILHLDVLLLIYHFAKFGTGNILEIGPYIGGSTIAAAIGARESATPKKIVSVEAGGRLRHRRIPSRNIFKDLKKNLARFGVSESLTLINGYSFQETTISAIRQMFAHGEVGLFIFDADDNVRRDLDCYGDLLADRCWLVIDDYFGPCVKAAPRQAQVNELVSGGRLVPFGFYGWSTWIGQWQRK
jgi:predicted O-methyltransferase YrrM